MYEYKNERKVKDMVEEQLKKEFPEITHIKLDTQREVNPSAYSFMATAYFKNKPHIGNMIPIDISDNIIGIDPLKKDENMANYIINSFKQRYKVEE